MRKHKKTLCTCFYLFIPISTLWSHQHHIVIYRRIKSYLIQVGFNFTLNSIKGLFNRAIMQSGSAYCHWSYTENVAQKTKTVAEMLGCPTSNSQDIIKCLRSRPGKTIAETVFQFMVNILIIL